MGTLEDDVVVVTGASGGLGRELALRFSREGARVVLASRSVDELAAVASEAPGETLIARTDVAVAADVEAMVEQAIERFGRVDALVNNAGIGLLSLQGSVKRLDQITWAEWTQVLETNLGGTFLCTRAVLPEMRQTGGGSIVNVTSALGRQVFLIGDAAWAPYTVSKHAIEALTRVTALEYEDEGIVANAINPGGRTDTAFWQPETWPSDREVETLPADVMNDAAVALLAQAPDGVTGESMSAADWEQRLVAGSS
jgi:3-oxoacyl-[acyl-carrier protein] reductase